MASLPAVMTQEKLDAQRDVVKNERRQSYENRPYGLAYETIYAALYPPAHPYHWPIIGWMPDLDAATLDDVNAFFRSYYSPANATLSIAGDVDAARLPELVDRWFGAVPMVAPPSAPPAAPASLAASRFLTLEDDVHLPRLYFVWHSPAILHPDDAELDVLGSVLSQGKSSRLYRSMVYERGIAQDVEAFQSSALLGSTFSVVVTARPGVRLEDIAAEIWTELNAVAGKVHAEEIEKAVNRLETAFVDALQSVGGFGGRADRLNHYDFYAGDPGYAGRDLERYRALDPAGVQRAARRYLLDAPFIALSVVPTGSADRALERLP
jgi:zinc protease